MLAISRISRFSASYEAVFGVDKTRHRHSWPVGLKMSSDTVAKKVAEMPFPVKG